MQETESRAVAGEGEAASHTGRIWPVTWVCLGLVTTLVVWGFLDPRENPLPRQIGTCVTAGDPLSSCIRAAHPPGSDIRSLHRTLRQAGFIPTSTSMDGYRHFIARRPGQIFAHEISVRASEAGLIEAYGTNPSP